MSPSPRALRPGRSLRGRGPPRADGAGGGRRRPLRASSTARASSCSSAARRASASPPSSASCSTTTSRGAEVLVGRCDDLFAPRPLGPLADIARGRPGPLADALAAGDPAARLRRPPRRAGGARRPPSWCSRTCSGPTRPPSTCCGSSPAASTASPASSSPPTATTSPADHPMRRAIGLAGRSLRSPGSHLPPLSVDAVRTLVDDRDIDVESLHARTGGNPFFLVETLAAPPGRAPRVGPRPHPGPGRAPQRRRPRRPRRRRRPRQPHRAPTSSRSVGDCDSAAVDECLRAGLLVDDDGRQAFRHDLGREAVDAALTPLRRRQLHARALAALGEDGDIVQRANHAVGAGDADAIVDLAWRRRRPLRAPSAPGSRPPTSTARPLAAPARPVPSATGSGCSRPAPPPACASSSSTRPWRPARRPTSSSQADRRRGRPGGVGDPAGQVMRVQRSPGATPTPARRAVQRAEALGDDTALAKAPQLPQRPPARDGPLRRVHRRRLDEPSSSPSALGLEPEAVYALNSYGTALSLALDGGDFDAGVAPCGSRSTGPSGPGSPCTSPEPAQPGPPSSASGWPAEAVVVVRRGHRGRGAARDARRAQLPACRSGRGPGDPRPIGTRPSTTSWPCSTTRTPPTSTGRRSCCSLAMIRARRGEPDARRPSRRPWILAEPFGEAQLIVPIHLARRRRAWLAGDLDRAAAAEVAAALH